MQRKVSTANRFEVSIKGQGEVLYLKCAGRLNAEAVVGFRQQTESAINEVGRLSEAVILDCGALDHISGLGWHHILGLAHTLRSRGQRLLLAELPPPLCDVFSQTDFLGLLTIHRTMADALGSMGRVPATIPPRPPHSGGEAEAGVDPPVQSSA